MNMKKCKIIFFIICAYLAQNLSANAQIGSSTALGSIATFKISLAKSNLRVSGPPSISLPLTKSKKLIGIQNFYNTVSGESVIIGGIKDDPNGTYLLQYNLKEVKGKVVIKNKLISYEYYTENGIVHVKEVLTKDLLCVDFKNPENANNLKRSDDAALAPPAGDQVYNLQSYPGAIAVVKLDFDGENVPSGTVWNSGLAIDAAPSSFNAAQIQEIWEMVSEDFRPFNLNITTSESIYQAAPTNRRMKCVITPTNTASPGDGGSAYVGSFTNGSYYSPCWVFNGSVKSAGETASHEIGHTMGLRHDGLSSPVTEYYQGQGNWAPIMGTSFYKGVSQWSRGEYNNANNFEDDIAKIASPTNGFGFRADESDSRPLILGSDGTINKDLNKGVLSIYYDSDFFIFTLSETSRVNLSIAPNPIHPNVDISAQIYTSGWIPVVSGDSAGLGAATLNATLNPGTYIIRIKGVGEGNAGITGYSDYGSVGSYFVSGRTYSCAPMSAPSGAGTAVCTDQFTREINLNVARVANATIYTWNYNDITYYTSEPSVYFFENEYVPNYATVTAGNRCISSPTSSIYVYVTDCRFGDDLENLAAKRLEVDIQEERIYIIGTSDYISGKLVDVQGRIIRNFESNNRESQLETINIPAGIYILEIQNGNEKVQKKIALD